MLWHTKKYLSAMDDMFDCTVFEKLADLDSLERLLKNATFSVFLSNSEHKLSCKNGAIFLPSGDSRTVLFDAGTTSTRPVWDDRLAAYEQHDTPKIPLVDNVHNFTQLQSLLQAQQSSKYIYIKIDNNMTNYIFRHVKRGKTKVLTSKLKYKYTQMHNVDFKKINASITL